MLDKPGTITAVWGDPQIGSQTGLSLPEWTIYQKPEQEIKYTASKAQNWIYDNWLDYWQYVRECAGVRGKHRKHRIVSICMGDIIEGTHHDASDLMHNVNDQIDMAAELLTPVANLSDGGIYGVMGTEAHGGANNTNEKQVVSRVGFKMYDQELLLDIDGLIIMAYHHGKVGGQDWTSAAAGVAVRAQLTTLQTGDPCPRLVFTAHNHIVDDSGEKVMGTRAITTPSWQLRTAFGYRVASGKRSDIGGLVVMPGGFVDFSRARYRAAPGQRKLVTI